MARNYDSHRNEMGRRQAAESKAGRDIAPIPSVVNPRRRKRAEKVFRYFAKTYFPAAFPLAWSDDHKRVISLVEQAVMMGGLFGLAMPRGSGKTTIAVRAAMWAVFSGRCQFISLIASTEERAKELLEAIQTEMEENPLLLEDFPEVIYPVRCLERITHRAKGQLYRGVSTRLRWTSTEIHIATIPGSKASGSIIATTGLTGQGIRGQFHTMADGTVIRPDLVILDDPQTTESAMSPEQNAKRIRLLAGDVLGMAGPTQKIAGLMPCTVIAPGDMADVILNRETHPEWHGARTKMVYSFPTDKTRWDEYRKIREESLRRDEDGSEATAYYRRHRRAMDEGAQVAWSERKFDDELSAIQHAMNLMFRDEAAFFAEYQNEPFDGSEGVGILTATQLAAKLNGMPRGRLVTAVERVTAFIDIQKDLLYYVVAAWQPDFTGYVIDYGTFPDQHRVYFGLRDVRKTLGMQFPGHGMEGAIRAGLDYLTEGLLKREWQVDDGSALKIDRCLVDANWGDSTQVVYQFCRQCDFSSVLTPSHGRGITAAMLPITHAPRSPGERIGFEWRMPRHKNEAIRYVTYDTNHWKTFTHARFATPLGDVGALSLWKSDHHQMYADQMTAETPIKTEGRGRVVNQWKLKTANRDNHFFDCTVGAAVAASIEKIELPGTETGKRRKRNPIRLSELQGRRRQGG